MATYLEGISLVIPCLNEQATIAKSIQFGQQGLQKTCLPGEVLIADNGSTDGSQEISLSQGARVIHVSTKGYGAALHHGIMEARYKYIVFADADLSYPLDDLNLLVQPLKDNQADLVLGSRLKGNIQKEAMPFLNRAIGTPFLSWLIRKLHELPVSDCNSGMRALQREKYQELNLKCSGMEYASEMLIRAGQMRWRYSEVPIDYKKDMRNRPPHLRRWRDGWRHLRFILRNSQTT